MEPRKRSIGDTGLVRDFISGAGTARLGLVSMGEPYVVPVNFVYREGSVFFHCACEGRKHEALSSGERVCVEFDETLGTDVPGADTWYRSVIAWGEPRFVEDIPGKKRVLEMLCLKYLGESRRITDSMAEGTCVVEIPLDTVTGKENLP